MRFRKPLCRFGRFSGHSGRHNSFKASKRHSTSRHRSCPEGVHSDIPVLLARRIIPSTQTHLFMDRAHQRDNLYTNSTASHRPAHHFELYHPSFRFYQLGFHLLFLFPIIFKMSPKLVNFKGIMPKKLFYVYFPSVFDRIFTFCNHYFCIMCSRQTG